MSHQTDTTYQHLRRLLIHGGIAPGTRLVESDWAQRLETNRSAIREAAMVLAHEGLLERGERGGYFAPQYTPEKLAQLQQVRLVLEAGAMQMYAINPPDDAAWEKLEIICNQTEHMIEDGYGMGFLEADRRFHLLLVELAGNPDLLRIYQSAPLPLTYPAQFDEKTLKNRQQETLADHRRIVALLRKHAFAEAEQILRCHLSHCHPSQPA